jgi:hypoxanthine phosphoribosyltransferase
MKFKSKFLDWYEVDSMCQEVKRQMEMKGYNPQSIIALIRGGLVPSRIFADLCEIRNDIIPLNVYSYNGIGLREENPVIKDFEIDVKDKAVLVVDDIWDTGNTMKSVLKKINSNNIVTATLLWKEGSENKPDYYARTVNHNEWIVFPWEIKEFRKEEKLRFENGRK